MKELLPCFDRLVRHWKKFSRWRAREGKPSPTGFRRSRHVYVYVYVDIQCQTQRACRQADSQTPARASPTASQPPRTVFERTDTQRTWSIYPFCFYPSTSCHTHRSTTTSPSSPMGGEVASWLGALADRFPQTPAPLLHLALHYYRNELDPGSDRAASLLWIPKLLTPRHPPLPVLARRPFEAHPSPRSLTDDDPVPLPPFLSSKCHTPYLQLLETLQDDLDAEVDVDALQGLLEAAMGALFARPADRPIGGSILLLTAIGVLSPIHLQATHPPPTRSPRTICRRCATPSSRPMSRPATPPSCARG